jgi:hypothetical protein
VSRGAYIVIAVGIVLLLIAIAFGVNLPETKIVNSATPKKEKIKENVLDRTVKKYKVFYMKTRRNNICFAVFSYTSIAEDEYITLDLEKEQKVCIPCDSIKNNHISIIED